MLHEFILMHREEILARTRARVAVRPNPRPTEEELRSGIPLFLDQLITILKSSVVTTGVMAENAAKHGAALLKSGFTVAQVVHDYGGVCQAVTELADEMSAPIEADDFRIFNQCLDDAIAQAVTEYTRQREQAISDGGSEQMGAFAHELRNAVGAANVAFEVLRMGKVGLDGSTAAVLGRSLRRLSSLVDRSLTQVRLETGLQSPERVSVRDLVNEVAVVASVEAAARSISFDVAPGAAGVDIQVDRALVLSSIGNLLQNALKFTRAGGHVSLRSSATAERVLVEVEDECGGLPPGKATAFLSPHEHPQQDRPGLGLSLTRRSIRSSGGELRARDIPGVGCVFVCDLPRY